MLITVLINVGVVVGGLFVLYLLYGVCGPGKACMTSCACGCGRSIHSESPWDGYHGPGTPIEKTRKWMKS